MNEYELDLNIVREIDLEVDTPIYKGADGTTFYPTVSSAGVISWSNDGDKENPDPVNIKGPQGDQGPAGQDGANGATFTPTVSSAGVISWTNDGGLPNPESVDIKGPAGQNGQGVPSGGTTGQVLKKTSATDYATAWADDEGGLKVNCTKAATPPYGITADKSYADILAAINDGINAVVVLNDLGQNTNEIYALDKINASALVFSRSYYKTLQNTYYTENLTFNSNGTITWGSTYFERDSWTLRPAIIFNFNYYGSGGLIEAGYISHQWDLQGFFKTCYPSYAIAVVKVYLDAVTFDHFDIYNCSKVWWVEDEDYILHGYATFERSRVGVSPDKIYIDELEIEWNQAYDLVTPTSRTAESAATAISDIYP